MPAAYLVKKVAEDVSPVSAKRVQALLAGKSTAASGKRETGKKDSGGLMASIMGLFR